MRRKFSASEVFESLSRVAVELVESAKVYDIVRSISREIEAIIIIDAEGRRRVIISDEGRAIDSLSGPKDSVASGLQVIDA